MHTTGISSLNSGNIAEPSGRKQLDTEDHEMIVDEDKQELGDNESNLFFLDIKMQCKNEYHKADVKVLDQINEKCNVSKFREKTN